jgi:23S rRNA pseudouridine1911/1915/1917 synthase
MFFMHSHIIEASEDRHRIDQVLRSRYPEYSRQWWTKQVRAGFVSVNTFIINKASTLLLEGDCLSIKAEAVEKVVLEDYPEPELWDPNWIVFEDDSVLLINKPAGLTVHPGAGQKTGTLMNALLGYLPKASLLPRAGIVHRLDKDTSGLLLIAKNYSAYQALIHDLAKHLVKRIYEGITEGLPKEPAGIIENYIGRDPKNRVRMAVVNKGGKKSLTRYQLIASIDSYAHMRFALETGRTHQIRVHCAERGFPLLGDPLYGRKPSKKELPYNMQRQALTAKSLGFYHPVSGEWLAFSIELPFDLQDTLEKLALV